jgi:hypothetical protein
MALLDTNCFGFNLLKNARGLKKSGHADSLLICRDRQMCQFKPRTVYRCGPLPLLLEGFSQGGRAANQCELPLGWLRFRSRWSLNFVKNFTIFGVSNTATNDYGPILPATTQTAPGGTDTPLQGSRTMRQPYTGDQSGLGCVRISGLIAP